MPLATKVSWSISPFWKSGTFAKDLNSPFQCSKVNVFSSRLVIHMYANCNSGVIRTQEIVPIIRQSQDRNNTYRKDILNYYSTFASIGSKNTQGRQVKLLRTSWVLVSTPKVECTI